MCSKPTCSRHYSMHRSMLTWEENSCHRSTSSGDLESSTRFDRLHRSRKVVIGQVCSWLDSAKKCVRQIRVWARQSNKSCISIAPHAAAGVKAHLVNATEFALFVDGER